MLKNQQKMNEAQIVTQQKMNMQNNVNQANNNAQLQMMKMQQINKQNVSEEIV